MHVPSRVEVMVVGAGPTGLTLGLLLARQGVRCLVVDRQTAPVIESRATDLHARTLELFAQLGLADELVARGVRSHEVVFYEEGTPSLRVPMRLLDSPYPFILSLPQRDTERLLARALLEAGGELQRDASLEDLQPRSDGVGAVVRTAAGPHAVEADFVVGCDGAGSTVREHLKIAFTGHTYAEHFVVADVMLDDPLARDALHVFLSRRGFFHVLPLPGEPRVRLFADLDPAHDDLDITPDALRELARQRTGRALRLGDPEWASLFRIQRRLAARYRAGRVLLAGDAAHVHSPVGGQGMNSGIQDAFNLAWRLVHARRDPRLRESLLDGYEQERRPVAERNVRDTHLATSAAMARGLLPQVTRAVGQALLSSAPLARLLADSTGELALRLAAADTHEHTSSLWRASVLPDRATEGPSVTDWMDFRRGPALGARMPFVTLGEPSGPDQVSPGAPSSSHALLDGARHVVLLFDGRASTMAGYQHLARLARLASAVGPHVRPLVVVPTAQRPAGLGPDVAVLLDPDARLHDAFGASSECAYVVRPDGYVGFRSQPASDEVHDYLRTAGASPA